MKAILFAVLCYVLGCQTVPAPSAPPKVVQAAYLRTVVVALVDDDLVYCAGVWVGKHAILTAAHCTHDEKSFRVQLPDHLVTYTATLVSIDAGSDLALLRTTDEPEHAISLPGALPAPGETVSAMGHPRTLTWSYSSGDVAALRYQNLLEDGPQVLTIQATAPISPGNSGGGLFNEHGELIGICSFMVGNLPNQNLNFFIPISYAKFKI